MDTHWMPGTNWFLITDDSFLDTRSYTVNWLAFYTKRKVSDDFLI